MITKRDFILHGSYFCENYIYSEFRLRSRLLRTSGVEMVNIDNQDVADGNMKLILGMVWHLILHYQVNRAILYSAQY